MLLVLAGSPLAQSAAPTAPGPERLPVDTWLLINWHGVANATQVRDTNPVMRLWNDPQFASARDHIITELTEAAGTTAAPAARRAVIDDALSLLENPIVFGVIGDLLAGGKDNLHFFAVLNKKGKEAAWTRMQARRKPPANAQVSSYPFRDVQIEKTVKTTAPKPPPEGATQPAKPKISYSFEASLGDYVLYCDDQATMESLITRLQDAKPAQDSLLKNAAYQRAQRFRATGAMIEMFLKVPDFSKLSFPQTQQINLQAAIRELHPERIQGVWFSAGMARDRMLVRGALLADMTPGGLLDGIGSNVSTFQTLAAAPTTESYGAFRIDMPALYAAVLRAVKAGMPPDRGAAAGMMIDGLVMAQTGMRAADLLSLFTGEIAAVTTGEERLDADKLPAVLMIPVTGSEQLLGILRKAAGPLFTNEEQLSGATVVKIGSLPPLGAAPAATAKKNEPFYLALSKNMLVISPDRSQLEGVLARDASGASTPAGSLAADAKFRAIRKALPAQLNGISYTDISRVNWQAYVEGIHQRMNRERQQLLERAAAAENGDAKSPPDAARAAQLRKQAEEVSRFEPVLTDLLPLMGKYLKVSAGGSWKASDGLFFDSFVN
jgi:hypothetical protein